jgi:magnesium-transporting ATPase (P-type)
VLHQRSDLSILLGQFQSLPVALLAGVAVVSLATGTLLEAGAIMAVVALNGVIGFTTESRADHRLRMLLSVVSLCSETEIDDCDGRKRLSGSATENALVEAALDHGIDVIELRRNYARQSVRRRSANASRWCCCVKVG